MYVFKAYSEKSKARRGLASTYKITEPADLYLIQDENGKWGFDLDDGVPVKLTSFDAELEKIEADKEADRIPRGVYTPPEFPARTEEPQPAANVVIPEVPAEPEHEEPVAPSPFGMFAISQLTNGKKTVLAEVKPERTASTKGQKIEKNRVTQNGVQMPSAGTVCRAVWDMLSSMMIKNEETSTTPVPTAQDIKAVGVTNSLNLNNVSIEYYRWRKFHGITGHGKKTV